jgi:uracil-DNA glycosylase family 4
MKEYKCTSCKLHKGNYACCIDSFGDINSEILFVAEYPNGTEDSIGRLFYSGEHVSLLNEILSIYDIPLDSCRVTTMLRCCPRKNTFTNEEMWACRPHLVEEINSMPNLKVIVTLGINVYHVISTTEMPKRKPQALGEKRGVFQNLEEFPDKVILPTYALGAIGRNPKFKDNLIADIKRVHEYITGVYGFKREVDYKCIYSLGDFEHFMNEAINQDIIAFDTETTSKDYSPKERVLCIQFSWEENTAWYLPVNIEDGFNYWEEDWDLVKKQLNGIFGNNRINKIGHNIKFDVKFMEGVLGIPVNNLFFDTMLGHFLISPDFKHDLKTLADLLTDMGRYDDVLDEYIKDHTKTKQQKEQYALHGYGIIPEEILKQYAMCDADATMRLFNQFRPKIDAASFKNVMYGINMGATRVFADAELAGICLDVPLTLELQKQYAEKLQVTQDFIDNMLFRKIATPWDHEEFIFNYECRLDSEYQFRELSVRDAFAVVELCEVRERKKRKKKGEEEPEIPEVVLPLNRLTALIPHSEDEYVYVISSDDYPDYEWQELNIQSPKQLIDLLFGPEPFGLGITPNPKMKTKEGNISVKAEALEELALDNDNPILNMIVEFRSVATIKSTFLDGMLEAIDPVTGRIHPSFNLHVARTGRTSCSNPNMQNIPRDSEEGGKIRNIFIPEPGNVFVDGDISQAEFRILGEASGDKKLLELLEADIDIHRYIASIVYKTTEDQVDKTQRTRCKRVVFGAMYGQSIRSLARELGIPIGEAEHIHKTFFGMCPDAEQWLHAQAKFAKNNKYISNLFGRIRYLWDVDSNDNFIKEATLREALNTPIQAGASDYVMVALISIYNKLKQKGYENTTIKITVHDSIIVDTPKKYALEIKEIMKHYMSRPIKQVCHVPMKADVDIYDRWSGNKLTEEGLVA